MASKAEKYFFTAIVLTIIVCSAQMAVTLSSFWLSKKVSAEIGSDVKASASSTVGVGVWTGVSNGAISFQAGKASFRWEDEEYYDMADKLYCDYGTDSTCQLLSGCRAFTVISVCFAFLAFIALIISMCTSKVYAVWAFVCLILTAVASLVDSVMWALLALDEYNATVELAAFYGEQPTLDYAFYVNVFSGILFATVGAIFSLLTSKHSSFDENEDSAEYLIYNPDKGSVTESSK
eukprot:Nk52_evm17s167 gene=Nk52_evmTU17s167